MNHHITHEARKYLKRMPQLVLDQINRMSERLEELEKENQYLRSKMTEGYGKAFQSEYGGQQYQPVGFWYPFRYRPFIPYFRGDEYNPEGRQDYGNDNRYTESRRGYDTPYQRYDRPYYEYRERNARERNEGDGIRYTENPQFRYNPNIREDSEPYSRGRGNENPTVNLEPVR